MTITLAPFLMKKSPTRFGFAFLALGITTAWPATSAAKVSDPERVTLALMRAEPVAWDLAKNFEAFLAGVELAVQSSAGILITPECWLDGYASAAPDSTPAKIRGIAQDLETSPYLRQVAEMARTRRLFICFGFTALEHGKAYNAAGLWDDQGRRVGLYYKTHLQAHDLQYEPGNELPVWQTPWGQVGIMICADRRWPETVRALRLQGARLILNPTYGMSGDLNEAMMRTRSYENQCFIAFTHPRQSLLTDPAGRVVAKQDSAKAEAPAILVRTIDLSTAKDNNHLQDRRPEIYRVLTETKK